MKNEALNNYKSGYSCSESIVKAAIDKGLIPEIYLSVATPFSGGLSSGCLCGAISGAQIVIGALIGRGKGEGAREKAKEFMDKFKEKNKFTCCKALTKGLEFGSSERKANCCNLVSNSAEILEEVLGIKTTEASKL